MIVKISLGLSIGLNLIFGWGLAGFLFLDWVMFVYIKNLSIIASVFGCLIALEE